MTVAKINRTTTVFGRSYNQTDQVEGDGAFKRDPTVPAAKTGTLTTRTDNDTGVIGAQAGHGIVSTNKVDVFWDGGSRTGMTATVAGDNITVDGGTGDNLPVVNTPVTLTLRATEEFPVPTGDNLLMLTVYSPGRGAVTFANVDDTFLHPVRFDEAGTYTWYVNTGITDPNPFAAQAITKAYFSNGDATKAVTIDAVAITS